jgi:hypothetical protein
MDIFYTYVYYDPSRDNEPIYVGKGKNDRAWKHLNKKGMHPFIQRLQFMRRHNITPVIGFYAGFDEEFALFLEEELIRKFGRKDLGLGTLLNLTEGGEGVSGSRKIFSVEHKKKLSIALSGKPKSGEHKQHIKDKRKLQIISEETSQKISDSHMGEKNHFFGKKHTEEAKARMADIRREYFRRKREHGSKE